MLIGSSWRALPAKERKLKGILLHTGDDDLADRLYSWTLWDENCNAVFVTQCVAL